jgi:hypothetical protein
MGKKLVVAATPAAAVSGAMYNVVAPASTATEQKVAPLLEVQVEEIAAQIGKDFPDWDTLLRMANPNVERLEQIQTALGEIISKAAKIKKFETLEITSVNYQKEPLAGRAAFLFVDTVLAGGLMVGSGDKLSQYIAPSKGRLVIVEDADRFELSHTPSASRLVLVITPFRES